MCTVILGLGILGPGSLLLGANRDESPERPSAEPGVLVDTPRVVGGQDLVSRGTWLAVRIDREGPGSAVVPRFLTALMNRRPLPGDTRNPSAFRSRGLLCLDVAAASSPSSSLSISFLDVALAAVARDPYANCTLVGVGVDGEAWTLHAGAGPEHTPVAHPIPRGWHVITHQDLNDRSEPRTAMVLDALARETPLDAEAAVALMKRLLRIHGEDGRPAVCLHGETFPTVSSSILVLGVRGAERYLHAGGPPCVTEYRDCKALLSAERRST